MPNHRYEVIVGNVGSVYAGNDPVMANGVFATYRDDSAAGVGRAAYEPVTLLIEDEIFEEYLPKVAYRLTLLVEVVDGKYPSLATVAAVLENSTAAEALSDALGTSCRLILAEEVPRAFTGSSS